MADRWRCTGLKSLFLFFVTAVAYNTTGKFADSHIRFNGRGFIIHGAVKIDKVKKKYRSLTLQLHVRADDAHREWPGRVAIVSLELSISHGVYAYLRL